MTIKLSALDSTKETYYALLEGINDLSRSFVVRLLNALINDAHKATEFKLFEGRDLSAPNSGLNRKKIGYRPIFELSGYASMDFLNRIRSGKFLSLKLIKHKANVELGKRTYLSTQQQEVSFRVKEDELKKFKGDVWEDIKVAFGAAASEEWTAAEFSMKADTGQTVKVHYDLETENFSQLKFVRATHLNDIDPPLADGAEVVVQHLAKSMIRKRDSY